MRERLPGKVGSRAGHLHERELQRQSGIAALAHVLDGDGEEVDQAEHGRPGKLVRLLAEPFAGLLGDRQRVGHVAEVLDEEQMAEMLEEVVDEAPEVLPLLGQLLDEEQRPRGVAVDDRVAEAEERVLLDRTDELEHRLDRDLLVRRRGELVERRDGVAERAARAACDQGEGGVGRVDLLALAHAPQQRDELGQAGPLERERLAA